jgi:2-keto-3-deoxy-galactonokinase
MRVRGKKESNLQIRSRRSFVGSRDAVSTTTIVLRTRSDDGLLEPIGRALRRRFGLSVSTLGEAHWIRHHAVIVNCEMIGSRQGREIVGQAWSTSQHVARVALAAWFRVSIAWCSR